MDPVTAVGLAAAILPFVQLGLELFSHAVGTHDHSGGKTAKMVAEDIVQSMTSIKASRVLLSTNGSRDWHNYEPLLDECIAISEEILRDLAKVPDSKGRGRFHIADFKKAFISIRSKRHVKNLVRRLELVRDQVILKLNLESNGTLKAVQKDIYNMKRQLDELKFDRRPKELGYTWETGAPKDYIRVDDGLDQPFLLPMSLCSSLGSLLGVLGVKYRSRKLPGRFQVTNGHIMVWNYEETQSLPMGDDCLAIPEDWRHIKLAFALATPWGGTASAKPGKCLRCRKPQSHRGPGKFNTCMSCKLAFRAIDPTVFPGELQDLFEDGLSDKYRDHVIASRSKPGETSPSSAAAPTKHMPSFGGLSEAQRTKLRDDPEIELVCRRMVIKWEPMFNLVHRYMCCRCILRKTSPASCEKEMTMLVSPFEAVCPRHNNEGVVFPDYGDNDYHTDLYFDRFGGYDMFRFMALISSKEGLDSFLGGEKFLSDEDFEQEKARYLALPDEDRTSLHEAIMEHYFVPTWDKLDMMKVPLSPYAAERLQEKRRRDQDRHLGYIASDDAACKESRTDLYKSPMMREVREICAGTWSGKPHWTMEE